MDDLPPGGHWFAYQPLDDVVPPSTPVRVLELREDEWADPLWDAEEGESLGDDFDDLHDLLGLSRTLYDDVMAWHRDTYRLVEKGWGSAEQHAVRAADLRRRLAAEVHPHIRVLD